MIPMQFRPKPLFLRKLAFEGSPQADTEGAANELGKDASRPNTDLAAKE